MILLQTCSKQKIGCYVNCINMFAIDHVLLFHYYNVI